MRNFDLVKKKAFTLSEVLIVLAIIGFIASVILGVIRLNTNRQFVAGSSIFTTDLAVALAAMNVEVPLHKYGVENNTEAFFEKLSQYFSVLYKTQNKSHIFALDKIKDVNGNKLDIADYEYYFVTKNGVSVGLSYVDSERELPRFVRDVSTIMPGDSGYEGLNDALSYVKVVYDLNGPKGPNVEGRDIGFIDYERTGDLGSEDVTPETIPSSPVAKIDPSVMSSPNYCPQGYDIVNGGCCPSDKVGPDGSCGTTKCLENCPKVCTVEEKLQCTNSGGTPLDTPKNGECCTPPTGKCNDPAPDCGLCKEPFCRNDGSWSCVNAEDTYVSPSANDDGSECVKSGGTWSPMGKNCSCSNSDKCGFVRSISTTKEIQKPTDNSSGGGCLNGKYIEPTNSSSTFTTKVQYCAKVCANLPSSNQYYNVLAGIKYDHCFSCELTNKAKQNKALFVTKYVPSKVTEKDQCGCKADCKNKDPKECKDKECAQVQVANLKLGLSFTGTSDSNPEKACKWTCNKGPEPNKFEPGSKCPKDSKGYVTFNCTKKEGCSCGWVKECSKHIKHPLNKNYVIDKNTCMYVCEKPTQPQSVGGDIVFTAWEWQGPNYPEYNKNDDWKALNLKANRKLYRHVTKDSDCVWKCNYAKLNAKLKDLNKGDTGFTYQIVKVKCAIKKSCNIDCNKLKKCIVVPKSSVASNCPHLLRAKWAFSDGKISRYYDSNYLPKAFGSGFKGNKSTTWSKSQKKVVLQNKADAVSCAVKITVDTSLDANKCKCNVKITTSGIHPDGGRYEFQYNDSNHKWNSKEWKSHDTDARVCYYKYHNYKEYNFKTAYKIANTNSCKIYKGKTINKNKNNPYTVSISERCTTYKDPIVLIQQEKKNLKEITNNDFNVNRLVRVNTGGDTISEDGSSIYNESGPIYWMKREAENSYWYLIKKTRKLDNGTEKTVQKDDILETWTDIMNTMFTDINPNSKKPEPGGDYSPLANGLEELQYYVENPSTLALDPKNSNWSKIGVAKIKRNDNSGNMQVAEVKSLDNAHITEIYLEQMSFLDSNKPPRGENAGAVGIVYGCYKKGVPLSESGYTLDDIVSKGYQRKETKDASGKVTNIEYCKDINNANTCVSENSTGTGDAKKYSFTYVSGGESYCSLNTQYGGNNYGTGAIPYYTDEFKKIYVEKPFMLVDILFKTDSDKKDQLEDMLKEELEAQNSECAQESESCDYEGSEDPGDDE